MRKLVLYLFAAAALVMAVVAPPAAGEVVTGWVIAEQRTVAADQTLQHLVTILPQDGGLSEAWSCPIVEGVSTCQEWSLMWLETCDQVEVASSIVVDPVESTFIAVCVEGLGAGIIATASDADALPRMLDAVHFLTTPEALPEPSGDDGAGGCDPELADDCDGGGEEPPLDDGRG